MRGAMDFDGYTQSYDEAPKRSISFAGADAARYVGAKARMLGELAPRRIGDPSGLSALHTADGLMSFSTVPLRLTLAAASVRDRLATAQPT